MLPSRVMPMHPRACLAHLARDVAYALQNSEDFLPMRLNYG
jgi:hypothetical protein